MTQKLRVEVPRAFAPLLQPSRYKGAYGGRGSGKSHFFGEQIILRCYRQPTRVACIREVQNSLKESVKQLLVDKIQKLGLGSFFEVLESEIRGKNGSLIIFRGMQSYNAETIKSLEGYDIAWVEEAQSLSDISLRMLRPTIRKDGSELWFSWNPRHDTDAVDKLLRSAIPPSDAVVVEVNWNDNPWFPEVLKVEKDRDYIVDPEMAEHVWGGGYQLVSEGAFYARWITDAEKQGRVGEFPHRPAFPVVTAWDLGVRDFTAIWFLQTDGVSATAIDYYEVSGDGAEDILSIALPEIFIPPKDDYKFAGWSRERSLEILGRSVPYKYSHHYLPHDIRMREWGHGARSRVETLMGMGVQNIRKGVPAKDEDRIQAVRRILPICRFNKTHRVEMGLKRLRRYRRKWNDALQTYTEPLHDENSHGCLVAGSLVKTRRGEVPIENVMVGDLVRTPRGFARVLWSGQTKVTDDLVEVEISDGRKIVCTSDHKIFTRDGLIRAEELEIGAIMQECQTSILRFAPWGFKRAFLRLCALKARWKAVLRWQRLWVQGWKSRQA